VTQRLAYGSWPSPITAELLVSSAVGLGGPAYSAGDLWWSELRPAEAGRVQIVRRRHGTVGSVVAFDDPGTQDLVEVLPQGFSARTRVHEYGGGAWWLHGDTLVFVNWIDQRLYRIDRAGSDQASDPVPLTPPPATPAGLRYADGRVDQREGWTVCVRESHGVAGAGEARNEIVAVPLDCSASDDPDRIVVLVGGPDGPDFVSNPRLSPDGTRLCWLQWDHPDMPWEGATVATARYVVEGQGAPALHDIHIHRGAGEQGSWAQPEWSPEGRLHAVREVEGWWRICSAAADDDDDDWRPITPTGAEWAQPQWVFGQSWYAFAADGSGLVACARRNGRDELHWLAQARPGVSEVSGVRRWGAPERIDMPFTAVDGVIALEGRHFACIAASYTSEPAVMAVHVSAESAPNPREADGGGVVRAESAQIRRGAVAEVRVVRSPRDLGLDPAAFSVPEHVTFPTSPGPAGEPQVAHAQFYRPCLAGFDGPAGHHPPLLVFIHGGPTSAARPMLNLALQFWTSRGFAVADVDYRGSTGYGRTFRHALDGRWGIADVDDCVAVARHLAGRGDVDGSHLAIRGGSAGGFTTLCALTFHDQFTAGTSLYGIADLEALATDTHKFESRYLDRLVGPYPEARDRYVARSPIHHVNQLATPLLILQGLEDEVVPPAQAEVLVAALAAKGVPHAYLSFDNEQHGFRQAATIKRAIEAELYFYGRMFGFVPADAVEPVPIT
jgi:dipeptidyl aminopeptidase/acylaminoacyl peptidase